MRPWGMNEAQWRAVTAPLGHLRINAGAGTGKTRALAGRILYLQEALNPDQILALSFSVTARQNLQTRVLAMAREAGHGSVVPVLTFHGLAHRIVRLGAQVGESVFRAGFGVLQVQKDGVTPIWEQHGRRLLQGVKSDLPPESRPALYQKAIDMLRQKGYRGPDQLPSDKTFAVSVGPSGAPTLVSTNELKSIWHRYDALLRQANQIDFPGILSESLRLMDLPGGRAAADIRAGLHWILVDEFQDTSKGMFDLLLGLSAGERPINVVGDADQTIYAFNGSHVDNIRRFEERVAGTAIPVLDPIDLRENYRSATPILAVANSILDAAGSSGRLSPSADSAGEVVDGYRQRALAVKRVRAPRLDLAADFVAREIQRLVEHEGVRPGEIAVLVRKNTTFSRQGYAVQEVLAGLGLSVASASEAPSHDPAVDNRLEQLCSLPVVHGQEATAMLEMLASGQLDAQLQGGSRDALANRLAEAISAGAETPGDVRDFLLDAADALEETGVPTGEDAVQIRTVHSAKGEEFRVVFLLYVADKQFPHGAFPNVEDERRLLYVGVTRAQERLYVIGQPVTRGEDFFGLIKGPEVEPLAWLVSGGPSVPDTPDDGDEIVLDDSELDDW